MRRLYSVIFSVIVIILLAPTCGLPCSSSTSHNRSGGRLDQKNYLVDCPYQSSYGSQDISSNNSRKVRKITIVPMHGLMEYNAYLDPASEYHYDFIPKLCAKLDADSIPYDVRWFTFREGEESLQAIGLQAHKLYEFIKKLDVDGPIFIIGYSQGGSVALEMVRNHPDILKEKDIKRIYSISAPLGGVPLFNITKQDVRNFANKIGEKLCDTLSTSSKNLLIQDFIDCCCWRRLWSRNIKEKLKATATLMRLVNVLSRSMRCTRAIHDMRPGSSCTKALVAWLQSGAGGAPITLIGTYGNGSAFFPNISDPNQKIIFDAARDALICKGLDNKRNDGLVPLSSQCPIQPGAYANIKVQVFPDTFHAPVDLATGGYIPDGTKIVLNNPKVIDAVFLRVKEQWSEYNSQRDRAVGG